MRTSTRRAYCTSMSTHTGTCGLAADRVEDPLALTDQGLGAQDDREFEFLGVLAAGFGGVDGDA